MKDNQMRIEMDQLQKQMTDLQQLVHQLVVDRKSSASVLRNPLAVPSAGLRLDEQAGSGDQGAVYFAGQLQQSGKQPIRWQPQQKSLQQLLELSSDKAGKVIASLGSKQRLDIIRAVLVEPLTGAELVERLEMGTTGQLYHHLKALTGADLIIQEQGGRYAVPEHRSLSILLLLAAASHLMDTSTYIDMAEARRNAGIYLGEADKRYDSQHLIWAVVENAILEHQAGHCQAIHLFIHADGNVTVSDNGRGIPTEVLPQTSLTVVQTILTDIHRFDSQASFQVPGAEQGISIALVNAFSQQLTVDIRRDGYCYRQVYKHGIPQTDLQTVGATGETGTSVTFQPDLELFNHQIDLEQLNIRRSELLAAYPQLVMTIHG